MEQDNSAEDLAAFQAFVKSQVEQYVREVSPPPVPQTPAAQEEQQKAVRELIDPFVQPGIQQANLAAQDAKDAVMFYSDPSVHEYREQVEKLFKEAVDAGRPTNRQTLLAYLVGQEYRKDPGKFLETQQARHKQQLEAASAATDMGAASVARAIEQSPLKNFEKMMIDAGTNHEKLGETVKEMEKALEGMTF